MKQGYFAFYWTFPVPWVGFTSLPDTVDEAETISRTIRYSRAQVRAHVAQVGGEILPGGEVACIELAPDRGSPEIGAELERLLIWAEAAGAMVAIVDFSGHDGWRGHQFLSRHYDHPRCDVIRASYEDLHLAGFNAYDHFEGWRARTKAKIAAKPDHRARIVAALDEIDGGSLPARAEALNALGLKTHGGKGWTGENLRKFVKAASYLLIPESRRALRSKTPS